MYGTYGACEVTGTCWLAWPHPSALAPIFKLRALSSGRRGVNLARPFFIFLFFFSLTPTAKSKCVYRGSRKLAAESFLSVTSNNFRLY